MTLRTGVGARAADRTVGGRHRARAVFPQQDLARQGAVRALGTAGPGEDGEVGPAHEVALAAEVGTEVIVRVPELVRWDLVLAVIGLEPESILGRYAVGSAVGLGERVARSRCQKEAYQQAH